MRTAIRWTGSVLLADLALLVILFVAPWVAYAVGADVQAMKWPVVFYGGFLVFMLLPISLLWVVLKLLAYFSTRRAH